MPPGRDDAASDTRVYKSRVQSNSWGLSWDATRFVCTCCFNLLLVSLSSGVIRLACSVHRSCIAIGTGETRTAIATSRNLASSVRANSNQGTDSLPGRAHEAACDVLVVDVDWDHLSCSTVDHLADGYELGSCRGNCQEGTHLDESQHVYHALLSIRESPC